MLEHERTDIYEEIVALRRSGGCAVLATIISGKGSVPSIASSKLLVREDGTTLGSIGGGFVETEVCRLAAEILHEERPRKVVFDLNQHPAADRGMVCGEQWKSIWSRSFRCPHFTFSVLAKHR
jgi:xanthine dehydrogenase accessory factor